MRASKKGRRQNEKVRSKDFKPRPSSQNPPEIHVSGAEGIYTDSEIFAIIRKYTHRALEHSRGSADRIVLTVEKIKYRPKLIKSLPVTTLTCSSPAGAIKIIKHLLGKSGISDLAAKTAFQILGKKNAMRGASLVSAVSGRRLEPDKQRGIRVSRLGISRQADRALSKNLLRQGINNTVVKEALILASKVSSCKAAIAELCISDNPDYTTGYFSSSEYGYVRIPHIKRQNSNQGGRVFFIRENADIKPVINYLEQIPVIVNSINTCCRIYSPDEFYNNHHK